MGLSVVSAAAAAGRLAGRALDTFCFQCMSPINLCTRKRLVFPTNVCAGRHILVYVYLVAAD